MKTTVNEFDFIEAFFNCGRASQFGGVVGLAALYQYLKDVEDDVGEEIELDVIAICCDYTYFEDIADYNRQYGTDYTDMTDIEELATDTDGTAFITYAH
jgi:hypothetical protein